MWWEASQLAGYLSTCTLEIAMGWFVRGWCHLQGWAEMGLQAAVLLISSCRLPTRQDPSNAEYFCYGSGKMTKSKWNRMLKDPLGFDRQTLSLGVDKVHVFYRWSDGSLVSIISEVQHTSTMYDILNTVSNKETQSKNRKTKPIRLN